MPKKPVQPNDLTKFQILSAPQISPDGNQILFSKRIFAQKNQYLTHLFSVDLSGTIRQWTDGQESTTQGQWSPDQKWIAFVSKRKSNKQQIFLLSTSGGEAEVVTDLPEGSISSFLWSPDSKHIAFVYRETHFDFTQEAVKGQKDAGLSSPPIATEDEWFRLDGDGYFGEQRYKVHLLNIETKKCKLLYDKSPLGAYVYDWTPDSKHLVVSHSACKQPLFETTNDQIFIVSLNGKVKQIEGLPKGEITALKCSPDGKNIAYIGDHRSVDGFFATIKMLYIVPIEGGPLRHLSEKYDLTFQSLVLGDLSDASWGTALFWSHNGEKLFVQYAHHGTMQLGQVDTKNGQLTPLTEGNHVLFLSSYCTQTETLAALCSGPEIVTEIALVKTTKSSQRPEIITGFNKTLIEHLNINLPKEVWLESPDGTKVQAWCIFPTGYQDGQKYPAILQIHGGPHGMYTPAYFHEFQVLAAAGYVVVFGNPRGSTSYGEKFSSAIKGDWGSADWQDVQTIIAWMKMQSFVDTDRLGVMGGSYGGYLTNWTVSHTNEFKAAITDRCVSNLVSMAGTSDWPLTRDLYWKGSAWSSLDQIKDLWNSSPISHFENVQTPMLIIHSEGDIRCNVEQGEQVFFALRARNIPARFVRYPKETSHGMARSGPMDLRLHRLNEILNWWERWLS